MKFQHICLAVAALAACGAVSAQQAFITQSGSNDTATIDQINPPGASSSASIMQANGLGNQATIYQAPNGTSGLSVSAFISQQSSTGAVGKVTQIGSTGNSSVQLTQAIGAPTADILQGDVVASQIIANQNATGQQMLLQQTNGTTNGYIRTAQGVGANTMTVLQGQPSGGVTNSQGRVIQNGQGNDAVTVQAAGSGLEAYTVQGQNSMPGYYYSNSAGGYVEVDRNVPLVFTYNSIGDIFQTSGSNHHAYIMQYGSGLEARINQSGDSNFAGVLQTNVGNTAHVFQSGMAGSATITQRGTGAYVNVTQSGVGNTATVNQR